MNVLKKITLLVFSGMIFQVLCYSGLLAQQTGGWKVYGPDNTAIDEDTDFESALMNAPMTYRATVDLKLGKILLGLNYTVDSNGFTFDEPNPVNLMPDDAAWGNGRIGASVLFTIF